MTDEHPKKNDVVRAADPAEKPVCVHHQYFIKNFNLQQGNNNAQIMPQTSQDEGFPTPEDYDADDNTSSV